MNHYRRIMNEPETKIKFSNIQFVTNVSNPIEKSQLEQEAEQAMDALINYEQIIPNGSGVSQNEFVHLAKERTARMFDEDKSREAERYRWGYISYGLHFFLTNDFLL